ncbi:hypothetical protein TNCV_4752621 [Trichonephila clavipes]|nr:hypothetical protein TNCV_4752621 [Trichonephila clavipes]
MSTSRINVRTGSCEENTGLSFPRRRMSTLPQAGSPVTWSECIANHWSHGIKLCPVKFSLKLRYQKQRSHLRAE